MRMPACSIITLSSSQSAMLPFLESLLASGVQNLEVLLAGCAENMAPDINDVCAARRIFLRFYPLEDKERGYLYADWALAVKKAATDLLWPVDQHTRLASAEGLWDNLEAMRIANADILHFKMQLEAAPKPEGLAGTDILSFFLQGCFAPRAIANKIYTRDICCTGLLELKVQGMEYRPFVSCFPYLLAAASAQNYACGLRDMAIYEDEEVSLFQDAQHVAALYFALVLLPDAFGRLGHTPDIVELAKTRLNAEFVLALGRVLRQAVPDTDVMDGYREHMVEQVLLAAFGEEKAFLNALIAGTVGNAMKLRTMYKTVFGDTVFNPCPAYY